MNIENVIISIHTILYPILTTLFNKLNFLQNIRASIKTNHQFQYRIR